MLKLAPSEYLRIETNRFSNVYYANSLLTISDNVITIYPGFEWNGCTWARDGERLPNGRPVSWVASCLHDALYRSTSLPLTRKQIDLIFYDELKKVNFKFFGIIPAPYLYYLGVRLFGGIFKRLRQ